MGGLTANWHVGDLDTLDDPDAAAEIEQLMSEGKIIDLSRGVPEIQAEIQQSLHKEGRIAEVIGLDCKLKWSEDHVLMGGTAVSCFNCPHHNVNPDDVRSVICQMGRDQHDLIEELAAVKIAGDLDEELVAAFARDMDAAEELAEALVA